MSRPIKFRAWDVFAKEMDYEVTIDPDGKVAAFNPLDGQYVRGFSDDEKVLMQYTGLKDRNGKEIYEGDIVEELDYSDGAYFPKERQPKKRTVVEYDIGFVYARAAYNLRGGMENELYKGEVIGNIYENQSLLEETK